MQDSSQIVKNLLAELSALSAQAPSRETERRIREIERELNARARERSGR